MQDKWFVRIRINDTFAGVWFKFVNKSKLVVVLTKGLPPLLNEHVANLI